MLRWLVRAGAIAVVLAAASASAQSSGFPDRFGSLAQRFRPGFMPVSPDDTGGLIGGGGLSGGGVAGQRQCPAHCQMGLNTVTIQMPVDQSCTGCVIEGNGVMGQQPAACQVANFSAAARAEVDKQFATPRSQACRVAAGLLFSARTDGKLLRQSLPADMQASRWLDVRDILANAFDLNRLADYRNVADLPTALDILRRYNDNCLESGVPGEVPDALEALKNMIIFVRPNPTYGLVPHCHGLRVDSHVLTARHCLADEPPTSGGFGVQSSDVHVGKLGQDVTKGYAVVEPAALQLRSFAWNGARFEEIKSLVIDDTLKPAVYSTDNRVFAPTPEFAAGDWIALHDPSQPVIAADALPKPRITAETLDNHLLISGMNANALAIDIISSNFSRQFALEDIVRSIRLDRSATCRAIAFEGGTIRHGCQTEGGVSGAPVFLRVPEAVAGPPVPGGYAPIGIQEAASIDGGACLPKVRIGAPNIAVLFAP